MVAVFIQQTVRDSLTVVTESKSEWQLNTSDRCDSCGAQAYVYVVGVTGDLLFCAHHYNRIMDNAVGYDKMMKFAYQIVDEREKLVENRLKES
jgi:predicted metalloprotease with PDZ domain